MIYHEGARYQVFSVQLPPADPGQDGLPTSSARRCRDCGYLHAEAVGIDVLRQLRPALGDTTRSLLRLTAVRTRRRDRISSDEEERRRAGFELQTSYRFAQHGASQAAWTPPLPASKARWCIFPTVNSTVRRAKVGLPRRRNRDLHGYMIDITTGRWLRETEPEGKRRLRKPNLTPRKTSSALSESSPMWRTAATS